jgi:ABC-type multidrug transport system fused ATPase/permease subunit
MPLFRKVLFLVLRTPRDRRNAVALVILMFFAAALEAVAVGLIMPFVALIQNPGVVETSRPLGALRRALGASSGESFVFTFGALLVGLFVVKNAYVAFVQWLQLRFIYGSQVALQKALVARYLGSPYTFHLQRNSAELVQSVIVEISLIANHVLIAVFSVAVELLTVLVVLCAMVAVEPVLVPVASSSASRTKPTSPT